MLLRFFCHKIFEVIHAKNVLLNVIGKKSFSLTKSKKENKLIKREENRILSTKYYYIRAFDLVTINRDTFSFVVEYAVFFFISGILRAGCNEIESNIVNCRTCLMGLCQILNTSADL